MSRWTTATERHAFFEHVLAMVEGPPKRTQSDVARELDLSAQRISQIVQAARLYRSATEGSQE